MIKNYSICVYVCMRVCIYIYTYIYISCSKTRPWDPTVHTYIYIHIHTYIPEITQVSAAILKYVNAAAPV